MIARATESNDGASFTANQRVPLKHRTGEQPTGGFVPTELQRRLDRLEEAFIFEKTIDHAVYVKQKDRVEEEMTIAELELHDARIDKLDVDGVLAFAEHLIGNVGTIWIEASLEQRQRIQAALFPEGILFDGQIFGTAVTCLALYRHLK